MNERRPCDSGRYLGFVLSLVLVSACSPASSGEGGSGGSGAGSGGATGGGGRAAGSGGSGAGSGGVTGSGGRPGTGGNTGSGGAGSGGTSAGSGGRGTGGGSGSGGTSAGSGGRGTGGSAAGSGGGTGASCAAGAPTPAAGGANFPFPQHRARPYCLYPQTCNDADVTASWQMYKARFIVDGGNNTLRVQRPENQNDTVSEGIAYGMLYAVYMNEKDTFDRLWQYAQAHLDMRGLMHWRINANGTTGGMNSATDSDEDMGFALIMADKQWGGYTTVATDFIALVAMHDFQADGTIRGGDTYNAVNPSYLAPAFYREFAAYTGDSRWTTILNKAYDTLEAAANATTGLVPDWSAGRTGPNYTYDATRTPYRVALDACWNNEPRAVAYAQKVGAFFAGIGVANIVDGYTLTGQPTGQYANSTFVGPAGAAGMVSKHIPLVTEAYAKVVMDGRMGTESYYNLSWALFTSLMMTGNFFNMSAPP
jgi:endo-1,4-beta-D-glucanase Y